MAIEILQQPPLLYGLNNPMQHELRSNLTGSDSKAVLRIFVSTSVQDGDYFELDGYRFAFSDSPTGQELPTYSQLNNTALFWENIAQRIASNPFFSEWVVTRDVANVYLTNTNFGPETITYTTNAAALIIFEFTPGQSGNFGGQKSGYSIISKVFSVDAEFLKSSVNSEVEVFSLNNTYNIQNSYIVDTQNLVKALFSPVPPTLNGSVLNAVPEYLKSYRIKNREQYRITTPTDQNPNPAYITSLDQTIGSIRWTIPGTKEVGFDYGQYYNIQYTNLRTEQVPNSVSVRFQGNPNQSDYLNLGNVLYTFGVDVPIGSTLRATISNFLSYFFQNQNNPGDIIINQNVQNSFAELEFVNINQPFNADSSGNIVITDFTTAGQVRTADTSNKQVLSQFARNRKLYGLDSLLLVSFLANKPDNNAATDATAKYFVRAKVEDESGLIEVVESTKVPAQNNYYTANLQPSIHTGQEATRITYQVFCEFSTSFLGSSPYQAQIFQDIIIDIETDCQELDTETFVFINEVGGVESYQFVGTLSTSQQRSNSTATAAIDSVIENTTEIKTIIDDNYQVRYGISASVPTKDWDFIREFIKTPKAWYYRDGELFPIRITNSNWASTKTTTYNIEFEFELLSTGDSTFIF